jgi:hypothetical protein
MGALSDGDRIFVTHLEPMTVDGDERPYVQYFVRMVDMADPTNPVVGPAVNIPGQLLAVDGDMLYTSEGIWSGEFIETAIGRLSLIDDVASLEAWVRFSDQDVERVLLDGAGHVLVSHRPAWREDSTDEDDRRQRLTLLDSTTLRPHGETIIDGWIQLQSAIAGRALFSVVGGVLVVNTDDPANPFAQAFFPSSWWLQRITLRDRQLLVPSGPYGITELDLDAVNILPPR